MNLALVLPNVVEPALGFLPPAMESKAARAMLVAIGLQESGFAHRHQVGGPAHGYWQFERNGGVRGVLTHSATEKRAGEVLLGLDYALGDTQAVYEAIEHNDILACCLARLLLWTLRDPLPAQGEADDGWQQYYLAWRPGKPHRATWEANFDEAWDLVSE